MTTEQLTDEELWNQVAAEREAGETTEEVPAEEPAQDTADTPANEQQQTATQQIEEDPYAGLPEAVRKKLEQADKLAERQRNVEGHIGGLTSELKRIREQLAAGLTAAKTTEAPSEAQIQAAVKSPEKWAQLKQDFPEWGEGTEELVAANTAALREEISNKVGRQDVDRLVGDRVRQAEESITRRIEERVVDVAHRGWRELVKTNEFQAWFGAQDDAVKRLAESDRAEDAIELFDKYKDASKVNVTEIQQRRADRVAQAAGAPQGKAASRSATVDTSTMTPEQLWEYEANLRAKRG